MVGPSFVRLDVPVAHHPLPLRERVVIVSLLHIVQLEYSLPAGSPSQN